MMATKEHGPARQQQLARLLRRPMSRRVGLRAGLLVVTGLLGFATVGCGDGGEEDEEEDD